MLDMASKGRSPILFKVGEANPCVRLTECAIIDIRRRIALGEMQKDLAIEYGVSKAAVTKIHFRRTWDHI